MTRPCQRSSVRVASASRAPTRGFWCPSAAMACSAWVAGARRHHLFPKRESLTRAPGGLAPPPTPSAERVLSRTRTSSVPAVRLHLARQTRRRRSAPEAGSKQQAARPRRTWPCGTDETWRSPSSCWPDSATERNIRLGPETGSPTGNLTGSCTARMRGAQPCPCGRVGRVGRGSRRQATTDPPLPGGRSGPSSPPLND